jgi:hypothetical protein
MPDFRVVDPHDNPCTIMGHDRFGDFLGCIGDMDCDRLMVDLTKGVEHAINDQ